MRHKILLTGLYLFLILSLLFAGYLDRQTIKELESLNNQWHQSHQEAIREQETLLLRVESLQTENEALEATIKELEAITKEAEEVLQWEPMELNVTHYAPLDPNAVEGVCFAGDPNITASGEQVEIGVTVAAGPSIPFGTRVYIPGYGYRVVQDRGGAISDRHLDIAIASRSEAYRLGREDMLVFMEVE